MVVDRQLSFRTIKELGAIAAKAPSLDDDIVAVGIADERKPWRKVVSYEVSGYNHNMADGFISLRPALFTSGSSEVTFRRLTYRARG